MPGLPGAIEKVTINDDGSVQVGVIDNVPAEGLCGSGLVTCSANYCGLAASIRSAV